MRTNNYIASGITFIVLVLAVFGVLCYLYITTATCSFPEMSLMAALIVVVSGSIFAIIESMYMSRYHCLNAWPAPDIHIIDIGVISRGIFIATNAPCRRPVFLCRFRWLIPAQFATDGVVIWETNNSNNIIKNKSLLLPKPKRIIRTAISNWADQTTPIPAPAKI